MRIVIGGASGLIGTHLCQALRAGGHTLVRLVRGHNREDVEGSTRAWDPDRGTLAVDALEGCDAVIHLGGVTIARRFTAKHKAAVLHSRVSSTRLLAESIARLPRKPRVFIVASAIGYYGDRGAEWIDESYPPGTGFLPEVCVQWECAADAARDAGVRVVHPRLGIVLSGAGGALRAMLTPFRLGLGGVVGTGRQYMSWIALRDVIGAFGHILATETMRGPVNLTAPHPVTNREFTKTLGRVLHRPTVLPLPSAAVKLLLGEMGQALLLDGCRVRPAVLEGSGYTFALGGLEEALRAELGT